jgi:hypothetical protein
MKGLARISRNDTLKAEFKKAWWAVDKTNHVSGWKIIGEMLALICGRLQRFGADVPKTEFERLRTDGHTLFYNESEVTRPAAALLRQLGMEK